MTAMQVAWVIVGQLVYFAGWADALDMMYVRRGALPAAWRAVVGIALAGIRREPGPTIVIGTPLPDGMKYARLAAGETVLTSDALQRLTPAPTPGLGPLVVHRALSTGPMTARIHAAMSTGLLTPSEIRQMMLDMERDQESLDHGIAALQQQISAAGGWLTEVEKRRP
jgi:hypothetical protein